MPTSSSQHYATYLVTHTHIHTRADTIECSSSVDDDVATISCDDLDGEPVEVTGDLLCSIDFGAPEACKNIIITQLTRFPRKSSRLQV